MVSVYEMVRERIINSLSEGTIPWQQTWQSLSPCNVLTKRPYRGINRILLSGHQWWGTYKQIKQLGGYVRKGEKASGMVVFWSFEEARSEVNDQGDEVIILGRRETPLVRYYRVFNLSQCEDIDVEEIGDVEPIASCEEIIWKNNPSVFAGEPACLPNVDIIQMPGIGRFRTPENYYSTFFHELTHWTGHKKRLGRDGVVSPVLFGSDRYSKEELTAEMGAAFLCAVSGIDMPVIENQTAYISGWLKQIRNGTAADVVRAAGDAQRAVDYLTGEVG